MWFHEEQISAGQTIGNGLELGAKFAAEFMQDVGGSRMRHEVTLTVEELQEASCNDGSDDPAAVVKLRQRTRRFDGCRVYTYVKTVRIELRQHKRHGEGLYLRVVQSMGLNLARYRTWSKRLGGICLLLCGEVTDAKYALFPGRYVPAKFLALLQRDADAQAGRLRNAFQKDELEGFFAKGSATATMPVQVATVVGVEKAGAAAPM